MKMELGAGVDMDDPEIKNNPLMGGSGSDEPPQVCSHASPCLGVCVGFLTLLDTTPLKGRFTSESSIADLLRAPVTGTPVVLTAETVPAYYLGLPIEGGFDPEVN